MDFKIITLVFFVAFQHSQGQNFGGLQFPFSQQQSSFPLYNGGNLFNQNQQQLQNNFGGNDQQAQQNYQPYYNPFNNFNGFPVWSSSPNSNNQQQQQQQVTQKTTTTRRFVQYTTSTSRPTSFNNGKRISETSK